MTKVLIDECLSPELALMARERGRAHLAGEDDSLVSVRPVLDRWGTRYHVDGDQKEETC
jgi:hypothetical protein